VQITTNINCTTVSIVKCLIPKKKQKTFKPYLYTIYIQLVIHRFVRMKLLEYSLCTNKKGVNVYKKKHTHRKTVVGIKYKLKYYVYSHNAYGVFIY